MNSHSGRDEVEKFKQKTANIQPRGNDNGVRIDDGSSDNRLEQHVPRQSLYAATRLSQSRDGRTWFAMIRSQAGAGAVKG